MVGLAGESNSMFELAFVAYNSPFFSFFFPLCWLLDGLCVCVCVQFEIKVSRFQVVQWSEWCCGCVGGGGCVGFYKAGRGGRRMNAHHLWLCCNYFVPTELLSGDFVCWSGGKSRGYKKENEDNNGIKEGCASSRSIERDQGDVAVQVVGTYLQGIASSACIMAPFLPQAYLSR